MRTQRQLGRPLRPDGAAGEIGDEGRLARGRRDLAHRAPAELDEILSLEVAGLADADDDKTRHIEPGRRDEIERRPALALEPIGCGRPHDEIARRRERTARGGSEFDPFLAEQDKNTLGGRGEGGKFKLQAAGHEGFSFRFAAKWKPVLRAQSSLRRLRELICGYSRKDVKRARFPRPARTRKGLRHPLDGRRRAWLKPFQAPRPRPTP